VGERGAAHGLAGLLGLRLGAVALDGELLVDLLGGLVDEGAGADHRLHGAQPIQLSAGTVWPSLVGEPGDGHFAR
jgi:hypothetical protein